MRILPPENEEQELASTRRPIELYTIYVNNTYYYLTSSDLAYEYWQPAPIKRTGISYDLQFKIVTCDVTVGLLDPVIANLIASTPIGIVEVTISKIYRDGDGSPEVFYSGQIIATNAQGVSVVFKLGSYEHNLKQLVPTWRIQNFCNFSFMDYYCSASPAYETYYYGPISSVNASGLDVTIPGIGAAFGANASKLAYGVFYDYNGNYRMIKEYLGSDVVRLNRACKVLVIGNDGYVELGCNGSIASCQAYLNMGNFGGHPDLPIDNPCVWSGF
jgi:hypothetical protein